MPLASSTPLSAIRLRLVIKMRCISVLSICMLDRPDADSKNKVSAIFVSDLHLGTRASQDQHFLEFLKAYDAKTLYLVGDLIDGWRLKRSGWYWPQGHNDVLQKLLRKARKGTKVIYIPGNHDEFLRNFLGLKFGGVKVVDRAVHRTVDGKRFLVLQVTSSTWWCAMPCGSPRSAMCCMMWRSGSTGR